MIGWRSRQSSANRTLTPEEAARFRANVLPHLDGASNLARWLTRDRSLAEEVVQEAMLKALAYFPSFRGGHAGAWLMRIVRNAAYDALAGRTMTDEAALETLADPADTPEEALTRRRERETLDRAIASLPIELRECLVLRELEELTYKEIAQVTETPIGTVMSRLFRARRMLIEAAGGQPA